MRLRTIGTARVSGLCIGGNPFSGFSHQNEERSRQMRAYYTPERIRQTLRLAESHGINTFFGRTDDHIFGILRTYWDEGGTIQWFAQVCTERGEPESWRRWLQGAADLGATAAYLHGGVVDNYYANGRFEVLREALGRMRDRGVVAGFAAHRPEAHAWIRDHLDPDFQMCSYYNPTDRSQQAQHISTGERWEDGDREAMLAVIATLRRPAVHYKVFAAGNKPVLPAFGVLGRHMRPDDVACVGFHLADDPEMIARDVALFEEHVEHTWVGRAVTAVA
ncbi:MAG: hypothetical protein AB1505_03545 [Candidatus Latescibacterota bacterium]